MEQALAEQAHPDLTVTVEPRVSRPVLIIMGSVRAGRRCPQVAAWVLEIAREHADPDFEIVDLKDWPLPFDDEPHIPAQGIYTQAHSRAWSEKVQAARGFVIVTPQYNWGYPAPLKNALDHLYREWHGKPLALVTYGGHGGAKCAAQLRQVAGGLNMLPVATSAEIVLTHEMVQTELPQTGEQLAQFEPTLRQALAELRAALL